jgi:hypothetical protein
MFTSSSATSPTRQAADALIEDADPARELSRAFDEFYAALSRKRKRHVKPTARRVPPAGN